MAGVLHLPRLMDEPTAAAALGMSIDTLQRLRKARQITFRRLSPRKIRYTDADVAAYIERSATPCADVEMTDRESSVATGFRAGETAPRGAGRGLTRTPDRHAVFHSALTTLSAPNSSSPNGSSSTPSERRQRRQT